MDSHQKSQIWNVPNQITMVRLVLSLILFATIPLGWYWVSLIIFIVAASTDWLDGWYARKYGLVTQLGRMLDPFCDKLIICGTYICLVESTIAFPWWARVSACVTVIVIGRELLVTALRSFVESQGGDFSAKMAGKIKMVLQCIVVAIALLISAIYKHHEINQIPPIAFVSLGIFIWLMVISTIQSGAGYVIAAVQFATGPTKTDSP